MRPDRRVEGAFSEICLMLVTAAAAVLSALQILRKKP